MQPDAGLPPEPEKKSPPLDGAGAAGPSTAAAGLPPVAPPSGKFILQLFLIPGLIVAGLVVAFILINAHNALDRKLAEVLADLDDPNLEKRERAKEELARILAGDERVALKAGFALDLAERLKRALETTETAERAYADRVRKTKAAVPVPKELQDDRAHVVYLASCLGFFQAPVGVPLLKQLALGKTEGDAETIYRRQTNALLALAQMGSRLRKFRDLAPGSQAELKQQLETEAEAGGDRGRWAAEALVQLKACAEDPPPDKLGVVPVLIECSRSDAPFLRNQAAAALSVWFGAGAEGALLRLAQDDGHGEDPVARSEEEEAYRRTHKAVVQRLNGKQVRYTAVLALARRGSRQLPDHLDVLEEMLDEEKQLDIWKSADAGKQGAAEGYARQTVSAALQTLEHLLKTKAGIDLARFKPALERLSESSSEPLKKQANELKKQLE